MIKARQLVEAEIVALKPAVTKLTADVGDLKVRVPPEPIDPTKRAKL